MATATSKAPPKRAKYDMTEEHKARLAEGRNAGRVVRRYIESLTSTRPRLSREEIVKRLEAVEASLPSGTALLDLKLYSERDRLQEQLDAIDNMAEFEQLEQEFIHVAAEYSRKKGITYNAWRNVGVPAGTLKAAGITRAQSFEGEEDD